MAQTSGPWNGISVGDAGPYSDSEWWDIWSHIIGYGANRNNAGIMRGTGLIQVVTRHESLRATVTSPVSAAVQIQIGGAIVDGTSYINDAAATLAIAANASGNPRIDLIVLRKDYVAQTVRLAVKQGTPASPPVPQTLTQTAGVTWEIPIAEVRANNGFVTIAAADITNSAIPANAPDALVIEVANGSGAVLEHGALVTWVSSPSGHNQVQTTTTANDPAVAGVMIGRTAAGEIGKMAVDGFAEVRLDAATTVVNGDLLVTSATAGRATKTLASGNGNVIARVLSPSGAASGLVYVNLFNRVPADYAYRGVATLSVAAATLALTGIFPSEMFDITIRARSEIPAAAVDTLLIAFGDGALDTTVTNYFSQVNAGAGPTPTFAGTENIGVAAGVLGRIPGSTAPASSFGLLKFRIALANNLALFKPVVGQGFYRGTGASVGTIAYSMSGEWINAAAVLRQLRLATSSGNNLSAGTTVWVHAVRAS